MSTPHYQFTETAKQDLKGIWRYTIQTWGQEQAKTYASQLKACCETLAQYPAMGRLLDEVAPCLRVHRCEKHYIFYLEGPVRITILAVLHQKTNALRQVLHRL